MGKAHTIYYEITISTARKSGLPGSKSRRRGHVTHQLPLSDVLLPPEVRTHGGDGRQAVVRVHEDMDEAVKCGTKVS